MAHNPMDDFEVVWNGGPLLPERDSEPDTRWQAISMYYADLEVKGVDYEKEVKPPKRVYNKSKSDYWVRRSQPGAFLQRREAGPAGEATTEGTRHGRYGAGSLSADSHTTEGRTEESLCHEQSKTHQS